MVYLVLADTLQRTSFNVRTFKHTNKDTLYTNYQGIRKKPSLGIFNSIIYNVEYAKSLGAPSADAQCTPMNSF